MTCYSPDQFLAETELTGIYVNLKINKLVY